MGPTIAHRRSYSPPVPLLLRVQLLLRSLAKFATVAAAAVVCGAALGIGLSEVLGPGEKRSPLDARTTGEQARGADTTTRAQTATQTQATATRARTMPGPSSDAPRVRVVSAVLLSATTRRSRARRRARLSVRVRVTNRDRRRLVRPAPTLLSGGARVRVDPHAAEAGGALLRPLVPGVTAAGELRFETAGEVTQRLSDERRARLRIAGRTVTLRVRIGGPAKSTRSGGR